MSKRKQRRHPGIFSLLDRLLLPELTSIVESFLGVLGVQDVWTRVGSQDLLRLGHKEMYFHPNGEIWCLARPDPGLLVRVSGLFPGEQLKTEIHATYLQWPWFVSFRRPQYDVLDWKSYPEGQTLVCHSNNGLHFGLMWKEDSPSKPVQFDVQIRLVHLDKSTVNLSQSGFQGHGPSTHWPSIACGWDEKQKQGIVAVLEDTGDLIFARLTNQEHQKLQWTRIPRAETSIRSISDYDMHLLVCVEHDLACVYDAHQNQIRLISLAMAKTEKRTRRIF